MSINPLFAALLADADAVVHMGAGGCTALSHYLAPATQRPVVLVEADPAVAQALERRVAEYPEVTVIAKAVSAEPGEQALHHYNLSRLNTLRPPTGLNRLYPGLKVLRTELVPTITAQAIFELPVLAEKQAVAVQIDCPGEEAVIVEQLAAAKLLPKIAFLSFGCGHTELYQGAPTAEAVMHLLESYGFEPVGPADLSDADRIQWVLRFNPYKNQCHVLRQEHKDLRAQFDQLKAQAAKEQSGPKLAELEGELEKAQQAIAKEQTAHEQTKQACKKLENQLERETSGQQRSMADSDHDHMAELAALEKQLLEANAALESARSDLSVALRTQALRDADLRELQQRYGDLLQTKQRQDNLLAQLNQRLSAAAKSLQEMDAGDASNAAELGPATELLQALSGRSD